VDTHRPPVRITRPARGARRRRGTPFRARGVEFTEQPEERPYGIDSGFRDPSGNSLRLTQVRMPASV
jgi:hypothetical protein